MIKSKPKIQTRAAPMPSPGSQPSTFHPRGWIASPEMWRACPHLPGQVRAGIGSQDSAVRAPGQFKEVSSTVSSNIAGSPQQAFSNPVPLGQPSHVRFPNWLLPSPLRLVETSHSQEGFETHAHRATLRFPISTKDV